MSIDISKLSVTEFDELIALAAKRREQLKYPMSDAQPLGELRVTLDPKWYISPTGAGTLLQIRDPGHNWLNFIIPPHSRAIMLSNMLQHALIPKIESSAAPVPASPGGGGVLH